MRKVIFLAAALAAATAATPALAASADNGGGEGRAEVRGGVVFGSGDSEGVAGVAAGYDWSLGSGSTFVGAEVSADKILQDNTRVVFGFTGRLGIKAATNTKFFIDGGYSTKPCGGCEDSIHAGVGAEFAFTEKLYGKVGYRHFFVANGVEDYDAVTAGVGIRF